MRAVATTTLLALLLAGWSFGGEGSRMAGDAALVELFTWDFDEDLDIDGQPDLWVRRLDSEHPHYIKAGLDYSSPHRGKGALAITAGGAAAEFLSPMVALDGKSAYDFSGYLRSRDLPASGVRASRASYKVLLYGADEKPLGSVEGLPEASGRTDWMVVSITDVTRKYPQARFLRVAAVLDGVSLEGKALFDSIEVKKRPIAFLTTNRPANLFRHSNEKVISFQARGLPHGDYNVALTATDAGGEKAQSVALDARADEHGAVHVRYSLPGMPPGHYTLRITLTKSSLPPLTHTMAFGILPDVPEGEVAANFGLTFTSFPLRGEEEFTLSTGTRVRWMKMPLGETDTAVKAEQLQTMTDLRQDGMIPVAALATWTSEVGDIVNAFAGRVHSWQLGTDGAALALEDADSYAAFEAMRKFVTEVSFLARVGAVTSRSRVQEVLSRAAPDFVSISAADFADDSDARDAPQEDKTLVQRWVWLDLSERGYLDTIRDTGRLASQLARLFDGGADVVFFKNLWSCRGVLDTSGNITPFGLALHTMMSELANCTYAGSIALRNNTPNAIFTRGNITKLLLWPGADPREERIFLGEDVEVVDMYGRRTRASREAGENVFFVKDAPVILHNVNQAVVKTRQTFKVEPELLDSIYEHQPLYVSFVNKFGNPIMGEVSIDFPPGWDATKRIFFVRLDTGESWRDQASVLVPFNALAGPQEIHLALDVGGAGTHKTTILRRIELGSLAFEMEMETRVVDGELVLYQKVTNICEDVASLGASLKSALVERISKPPRDLAPGASTTFTYRLPDAGKWAGEVLRLAVRDRKTDRFLNRLFTVPANVPPQ